MYEIEVGKLYAPGVTSWPERGEFLLYDAGLELRLFFGSPTPREVNAVRKGPCRFALKVEGDVLFLLYQFGTEDEVPWSDVPFTWHLVPEDRRTLPSAQDTGETRAVLQTVLIDASTGIVRAIRAVSLSPDFTRALLGAIRVQASTPWPGRADYERQLADVYRRYPTTEALLASATHQTQGGT
jgi:hypothetical protein